MSKKIIEDAHLGDGVYASFDGYHIVLDLRGQDSTTRIAMEPPVVGAFIRFNEAVHEATKRFSSPEATKAREAMNEIDEAVKKSSM